MVLLYLTPRLSRMFALTDSRVWFSLGRFGHRQRKRRPYGHRLPLSAVIRLRRLSAVALAKADAAILCLYLLLSAFVCLYLLLPAFICCLFGPPPSQAR